MRRFPAAACRSSAGIQSRRLAGCRTAPGQQVRLARRVRLDLGGIAKGFAVDQAIAQLRDAGVVSGSVNAGGDLRVLGNRRTRCTCVTESADTATAGVDNPCGGRNLSRYFQHRQWAGRLCCPIVHPGTRLLCDARRSVTVFADNV